MILKQVILLNITTVRLTVDFSGTAHHFDVPLSQITTMDATSFTTWAQANLVPPTPPTIPAWLSDLEGTTL